MTAVPSTKGWLWDEESESGSIYIGTAAVLTVDADGVTVTGALSLDGDLDFTGPQEISTTSGSLTLNPAGQIIMGKQVNITANSRIDDDVLWGIGADFDYFLVYGSSNTRFALTSTNVDGAGTNGDIMRVEDGADEVVFLGGVGMYGVTPPATQPNVPTTSPTVQDVIDALVALGLVEQSDP